MDSVKRRIFGHGDLDRYSLAEVRALKLAAGLECLRCHKYAALDIDHLEARDGPQLHLGDIRRRAKCQRCGCHNPVALIRSPVMRGDRAWYPRPPGATR